MHILMRSNSKLGIFDVIIKWVIHYSRKTVNGNLWTDCGIASSEKLLKIVSSTLLNEDHRSCNCDVVVSGFDNRRVNISTFNFISKKL